MKKFGKILILALSLVIALSAFAIASSANTSPFLVEGLYRENWEEAIENAYIKGDRIVPVELLTDYEANGESVEITESVVISLNGHTLKSAAGAPLFTVSGKDTTLTIIGPGTIVADGTLIEVQSGTLVFDASRELSIVSEGSDSVAVIGGADEKAYATITSNLNFESSSASLFELASGAEFKLATGGGITAKPSASATDAFAILSLNSGSKVNVLGGSLANAGGSIFKIGDDTEAEAPVSVSCESAVLISNSASYGSIVEAGSGHANVDIRYSEVVAAGGAFSADDTIMEYEGEGRDKVYAKPNLKVNFVASTYTADKDNANANASLFFGNVTGIVIASDLWNTETSKIGINTRLWDGECGVVLKKGTKVSVTTTIIASDNLSPLKDEDGVTIYFNPNGNNNNFSLETINDVACTLQKTTEIRKENELVNCVIVTDKITSFVDSSYSSTFNDPNGVHPVANAITQSYGYLGYEVMKEADGTENRYFKWEYDTSKNDQYPFASGNSYFELDAGSGGGTRGFNALVKNELVTWDFDIACSNGTYSYAGLKLFIREGTSSYAYTDNFAYITGNNFRFGNSTYSLPTTPYTWTHITLVFDIDSSGAYLVGNTTYYPNLVNSQLHLYVNGDYETSLNLFNSNIATEEGMKRGAEFSLDSIRFGLNAGTAVDKTKSTSLIFDNNIITYYPKGYSGNVSGEDEVKFNNAADEYYNYKLACQAQGKPLDKSIRDFYGSDDITIVDAMINKGIGMKDLYDVVYKKGYHMPGVGVIDSDDRIVTAVVDGVNYYDIDSALSAITDNSVVYIYTDIESDFNAKTSFTVYTKKADGGNYKFNVTSDSYYLSEVRENGEVVGYKTLLANTFITIYWQINTGYKTEVPLGIVPTYDWIVPSAYYDSLGRYVELIGWSSEQNATEPEEIGAITKDDLIKGYKVYYPVIAPSRVPVSFVDGNGAPLKDENGKDVVVELPVGTPESQLIYYCSGSSLPAMPFEGNDWYEGCFSAWSIPGDAVGLYPVTATPEFEEIRIRRDAIKTSFTWVRLVDFTPSVYLLQPSSDTLPEGEVDKVSFVGFSLDGKNLLEGTANWDNKYIYEGVKIGEDSYYKLNFARSNEYAKPGAEKLNDFVVYVHYKYDGVTKLEEVRISFASYLEAAFKNAKNDTDKSAMLEIMRLVKNYLELADKASGDVYSVCSKYVNDANNAKYLSDYTKALDSISDEKKAANAEMLAALYEYAEDNIRWDFVTNSFTFTPKGSKYPGLNFVNGFSVDSAKDDGIMVQAHAQISGRLSNTTVSGASSYTYKFTFSFGSNSNYNTCMIVAYDSNAADSAMDLIRFVFYDEYLKNNNSRPVLHIKYYNLTAHISELERRMNEGEGGLASELKMAQIILATQTAVSKCATESGVNINGATHIPAV